MNHLYVSEFILKPIFKKGTENQKPVNVFIFLVCNLIILCYQIKLQTQTMCLFQGDL